MSQRQRVSVEEIARMTAAGGHLPPTTAPAAPQATSEVAPAGKGARVEPGYQVVPINFKCTPDMARLLARLAEPEGGIRRFLAKTLQSMGHDVPAHDLNPPTNRRWGGGGKG
jgi:hypothetical protein